MTEPERNPCPECEGSPEEAETAESSLEAIIPFARRKAALSLLTEKFQMAQKLEDRTGDIYIVRTSEDTPDEDSFGIVLTKDGKELEWGEDKERFEAYFPYVDVVENRDELPQFAVTIKYFDGEGDSVESALSLDVFAIFDYETNNYSILSEGDYSKSVKENSGHSEEEEEAIVEDGPKLLKRMVRAIMHGRNRGDAVVEPEDASDPGANLDPLVLLQMMVKKFKVTPQVDRSK